jgi:hypothetical protein
MLRIELRPTSTRQPGYAELTIHGLRVENTGLEIAVQRNQDSHYLGSAGEWGGKQVWHCLPEFKQEDSFVSTAIGPALVDPMLQNPRMQYLLHVRSGGHIERGALRIIGTILSSSAAGNSLRNEEHVQHDPGLEMAPVCDETEKETEELIEPTVVMPIEILKPADEGPSDKRRQMVKLPLILLLVFFLLATGAALFWYFFLKKPPDETLVAGKQAEIGDCSAETLDLTKDDLAFIQACMRTKPSSEQILEVISSAKQTGRCDVMQRLYAYKAQSGDVQVAVAYAREYDPQSFHAGGCIKVPDVETAIYWYEVAVQNDNENKVALERLGELRK